VFVLKIHQLIQKHRTTLIFTNTRAATERVINHLREMFPENYLEKEIGALILLFQKNIDLKLKKNLEGVN